MDIVATIHAHEDSVYCVALSPDGSALVSCGREGNAKVWSTTDRGLRFTVRGGEPDPFRRPASVSVLAATFSDDGKLLATCTTNSVAVWRASDGQAVTSSPHPGAECLAFLPSGDLLAAGADGQVLRWSITTGQWASVLSLKTSRILSMDVAPGAWTVAMSTRDGFLFFVDALTWQVTHTELVAPGAQLYRFAFAPDGHACAATVSRPGGPPGSVGTPETHEVVLWDAVDEDRLRVRCRLGGHAAWIGGLAFAHRGEYLASGSYDGSVRLWNPGSGELVDRSDEHGKAVYDVTFSPVDDALVSCSADGTVVFWRAVESSTHHAGARRDASTRIWRHLDPIADSGHAREAALTTLDDADRLSRRPGGQEEAMETFVGVQAWAQDRLPFVTAYSLIRQAELLERLGDKAEAVARFDGALKVTPNDVVRANCLERMGTCELGLGRRAEARAHLLEGLRIVLSLPDRVAEGRLRFHLGEVARAEKRWNEGRSWYLTAVDVARQEEDWTLVRAGLRAVGGCGERLSRRQDAAARAVEEHRLTEELGELAYVGSVFLGPSPRSAGAPDLLTGTDVDVRPFDASVGEFSPQQAFERARALRNAGYQEEAADLYRAVASHYQQTGNEVDLVPCLTGWGGSLRALMAIALRSALQDLASTGRPLPAGLRLVALMARRTRSGTVIDLAERARACHLWARDLTAAGRVMTGQPQGTLLAAQANHMSNLGGVEETLGNLDTAVRYQAWAFTAHRRAGWTKSSAVDAELLVTLAERLGDDSARDRWRSEAEALRNAR